LGAEKQLVDQLEAKGRLVEQFRVWLLGDRYTVREAIELIESGDISAALALLKTLELDLLEQQSC
jgi:hypothetical protein